MTAPAERLRYSEIHLPDQFVYHEKTFPLILQCDEKHVDLDTVDRWIQEHSQKLTQQASEHGAVLFRGFPLTDAHDFDRFVKSFGYSDFPYDESLSNAVRINYTPRVFSANEAPPDVTIFLHHEMAQTPIFPQKLFFFCAHAPAAGGTTPVCRSDILFDLICEKHAQFARDCQVKGLRYTTVMPSGDDAGSGLGRSWQKTFNADVREQAEERMRQLGYRWSWLEDGCLRATTPQLPAVRQGASGRKTFFNQLIAAFKGWKDSRNDPAKAVTFADGSALDQDIVFDIVELAERCTFDIVWQNGDVALLDNVMVMHGRRPFSGKRQILASLADACRITTSV